MRIPIRSLVVPLLTAALLGGASFAPAALVRGTVYASDGTPIAGATVSLLIPETARERALRLDEGKRRSVRATTRSDGDGAFALEAGDLPIYEIEASAPGRRTGNRLAVPGFDPGGISLSRVSSESRRLLLERRPLAGARVAVLDPSSGPQLLTTDAEGRFSLADAVTLGVLVLDPRIALEPLDLGDEDGDAIDLKVAKPLTGQVLLPDGKPAGAATIRFGGLRVAIADANGRYSAAASPMESLFVESGGNLAPIPEAGGEVRLEAAGTLAGQVRSKDGKPLAALVAVYGEHHGYEASALAGSDGRFEIRGLPADSYFRSATRPGWKSLPTTKGIAVAAGARVEQNLMLEPDGARMVHVVDGEGRPVAGATVFPWNPMMPLPYASLGRWAEMASLSDSAGQARLPNESLERAPLLVALRRGYAVATRPLAGANASAPIEIVLERGIALVGRVLDEAGAPLAGVTVAVLQGPSVGQLPANALFERGSDLDWYFRSDADGRFEARVQPGVHQLGFQKRGFAARTVADHVAKLDAPPLEVRLEATSAISGQVVDHHGMPIAEVVVSLERDGQPAGQAESDAQGAFRIGELARGSYALSTAPYRLAAGAKPVEAPAEGLVLAVERGLQLAGQVVDAETGADIAEFEVEVERPGRPERWDDEAPRAEGKNGRFVLDRLEPGAIVVQVRSEGYREATSAEILIAAESEPLPLRLELTRGVGVSGRITDDAGRPLARAEVRVDPEEGGYGVPSMLSDADGAFSFTGLGLGPASLAVELDGYVDERREIEIGEKGARVDVKMLRGSVLSGRVVDVAGTPLERAQVSTRSPGGDYESAQTDPDGRFEVAGLRPGLHDVSVRLQGWQRRELPAVDVRTGEELIVRLERASRGTITGQILGLRPGEVAMLMARAVDGEDSANGMSDADGRYRIDDAPLGAVRVGAYAAGGQRSRTVSVDVTSTRPALVDIDLSGGFAVSGMVMRAGAAVPMARLFFSGEESETNALGQSDAGGQYRVEGLVADRYDVQIILGERSVRRETIDLAGARSLDFDLAGGTIAGRVLAEGQPVAGATVSVEDAAGQSTDLRSDSRGAFLVPELVPGEYTIRAEHPDWSQAIVRTRVDVDAATAVELVLIKAAGIVVTLVDARSGETLSGTVVARDLQNRVVFDGQARKSGEGVRIPLPDGTYKVSASAHDLATVTRVLGAPSPDAVIALRPGGTILVRSGSGRRRKAKLIDATGEEYVRCWCNRIAEIELAGSLTKIEHVAAGAYTLVVSEADGSDGRHPVAVVEGGSVELAID